MTSSYTYGISTNRGSVNKVVVTNTAGYVLDSDCKRLIVYKQGSGTPFDVIHKYNNYNESLSVTGGFVIGASNLVQINPALAAVTWTVYAAASYSHTSGDILVDSVKVYVPTVNLYDFSGNLIFSTAPGWYTPGTAIGASTVTVGDPYSVYSYYGYHLATGDCSIQYHNSRSGVWSTIKVGTFADSLVKTVWSGQPERSFTAATSTSYQYQVY